MSLTWITLQRRVSTGRIRPLATALAVSLLVGACGNAAATPTPDSTTRTSAPPSIGIIELTIGTDSGTDLLFSPDEATVVAGAMVAVRFENRATVVHNLTFPSPIDAATAASVGIGESETVEFTAPGPGEYTFVCLIHPGMEGTLTVDPAA